MLGLTTEAIKEKLTTRKLESKWGNQTEKIDVRLNVEQATYTRDAWVKGMYSRLFDFLGNVVLYYKIMFYVLVTTVNNALNISKSYDKNFSIGILDIYGFEIFDHNGFEQFW